MKSCIWLKCKLNSALCVLLNSNLKTESDISNEREIKVFYGGSEAKNTTFNVQLQKD